MFRGVAQPLVQPGDKVGVGQLVGGDRGQTILGTQAGDHLGTQGIADKGFHVLGQALAIHHLRGFLALIDDGLGSGFHGLR